MTLPRWVGVPEVGDQHKPWSFRGADVCVALIVAVLLIVLTSTEVIGQVSPEVRDRVIPAAVQIFIVGEVKSSGLVEPLVHPMGSGTVVSAQGQILTNWHVVDMATHRTMLNGWESQAASEGQPITIEMIEESFLIFTSDGESTPKPHYIAKIVAADKALDLAVLQIIGDGTGLIDPAMLRLPFVPLGDSDAVGLGDPIDIFGYPQKSGGILTYTEGVVSGFVANEGAGRSWIVTDATISGGSSGGTAINRAGELIGVPTLGSELDCRPDDMNSDGRLDATEVACFGGSFGELRPINLAANLLSRAGVALTNTEAEKDDAEQDGVIGEQDGGSLIRVFLPPSLPLPHSSCFAVNDEGSLTFGELADRLGGTEEARQSLNAWGWRGSAFRTFGCDGPPEGEAGWIDISLHQFGDAAAAREAVDYFAEVRADGTALVPVAAPVIGDHAAALTGPASNGSEFTLYASQGPLLVRVTGVSPSGIPFMNVLAVAQSVLADNMGVTQSNAVDETLPPVPAYPASAYLPSAPAVNHAECFQVRERGSYDSDDVADALLQAGMTSDQVAAIGWTDGAYVVFSCADPPVGRANQIDVGVHQFRDGVSAQQALPYYSAMYDLGANAARSCDATDALVVCVSGRSLSGSPLSDVHFVLNQVIGSAR